LKAASGALSKLRAKARVARLYTLYHTFLIPTIEAVESKLQERRAVLMAPPLHTFQRRLETTVLQTPASRHEERFRTQFLEPLQALLFRILMHIIRVCC
jgi:hypothetical protein